MARFSDARDDDTPLAGLDAVDRRGQILWQRRGHVEQCLTLDFENPPGAEESIAGRSDA